MRRIISWFSWQKVVFILLVGVVVYQSRLDGSLWVIGWDSIMPEFNWKLNFSRALGGMWQEYQGVGLTGGMAHLADLSRMIALWMIDLVVPTQYVRWVWHMAMLVLGSIGVWYLGKKLWEWNENACLVASVFYLLNLATVQYFFVPYEAFSSFYGFLPWLIAVFLSYLESGTREDLWKMVIVGLLVTSAFYVQTLFVVYAMVLGALSLGYLKYWKRVLIGFLTIFLVNSFWLLPVIYGVVSGGGLVGLAKINSIGSPETALMNNSFGNWENVSLLKGYWLEYIEWVGGSEWGRLMQTWHEWSGQGWVMWVGLGMFGVGIFGLLWGVAKRRIKWGWPGGLLLAYIMLASFNAPFGTLYQWLAEKIPLFGEMFRSVFTKWSVALALFVSVGIGGLVTSVKNKWVAGIMVSLIVVGCVGILWPVFKTGMIFDKMKVEIPAEYFKMFEFMKSRPKGSRMAYLPAQDMWSWKYNDWGYRGSGFLWYGIEQPILDRAFDVWSPYNEGFYNQFSTALYGGNKDDVARVLTQYDVRYVLLDESVIAPGQGKEILRIEETKKLAKELGWEQKFQEGFLTVWDTNNSQITNDKFSNGEQWVSAQGSYTWVEADTNKVREDVIGGDVGTYISANQRISESAVTYPFAGLMREEIPTSSTTSLGTGMGVEYGNNKITLSSDHSPIIAQGSELRVQGWKVGDIVRINFENNEAVPAYRINGEDGPRFLGKEKPEEGKDYIVARVSEGNEWKEYLKERKFDLPAGEASLRGETLQVEVAGEPQIYDFGKDGKEKIENCDVLKRGEANKVPPSHSDTTTQYIADGRGAACDYIEMKELDTRLSYLMRVQGENREGRSLKYFLYNTGSKRNDIEYLLGKGKFDQTFSLLPWAWDGTYTLNIETRSFGQRAENVINPMEVRWFPMEQIAGATIVNGEQRADDNPPLLVTEVKKTGTWLYRVKAEGSGLLRLSQGYDEGWISFDLEHVKVDGWANGWIIPGSGVATIFYWPQLLEYLGFAMLGGMVLILVIKKK